MKNLNPGYDQAVAERVPTKMSPLGKDTKKFMAKILNLVNVPTEFGEKCSEVILRHHEAISQHKFDLGVPTR